MNSKVPLKSLLKFIPAKYSIYITIVALLLMFFANGSVQQQASEFLGFSNFSNNTDKVLGAKDGVEEVQIAKVSDGDTVTLKDGRRVRYLNIDTPESVKRGTEVQCYALKASYKNKELVSDKTVYLTRDKSDKDRYGRDLAFIFLNKEDTSDMSKSVNATLIKQGYARGMFYSPNTTYKQMYKNWEQEAKDKGLGLWSECPNLWKK